MRIGGVSVGKVKLLSPADRRATRPGRDRALSRVRADPRRHAGDPASEDAARRDLHRADRAAPKDGPTDARRRAATWPDGPDAVARPRSTRSSTLSTSRRARRSRTGCRTRRSRSSGRGLDLNDSFGNLGPFTTDATDILRILNAQSRSLQGLVRDTGHGLRGAVRARRPARERDRRLERRRSTRSPPRDQALAETIQIFPTFNEESRLTLDRLAEFANNTRAAGPGPEAGRRRPDPDLPGGASASRPTCGTCSSTSTRCSTSRENGLPALRKVLGQLKPVLAALDPFLANLNPIIRYTDYYRNNVSDFMSSPPAGLGGTLAPLAGQPAPRHTLRQLSYLSTESLSVHPERLETNRGNGYLQPLAINSYASARRRDLPELRLHAERRRDPEQPGDAGGGALLRHQGLPEPVGRRPGAEHLRGSRSGRRKPPSDLRGPSVLPP